MPLSKPWESFDPDPKALRRLSGAAGVYELADEQGAVIYIGYAGSRALHGLRGCIAGHFSDAEPNAVIRERARRYRYEVNMMYYSRWVDLLSRFNEDYERLPPGNEADPQPIPRLGRFHWKSWAENGAEAPAG